MIGGRHVQHWNMMASMEAKTWWNEYQFSDHNRKTYLTFMSVFGSVFAEAGHLVCHLFYTQQTSGFNIQFKITVSGGNASIVLPLCQACKWVMDSA